MSKTYKLLQDWQRENEEDFIMDGPLVISEPGVSEVFTEFARLIKEDPFFYSLLKEPLADEDIDEDYEEMLDMMYDISDDEGLDTDIISNKALKLIATALDNTKFDIVTYLDERV